MSRIRIGESILPRISPSELSGAADLPLGGRTAPAYNNAWSSSTPRGSSGQSRSTGLAF